MADRKDSGGSMLETARDGYPRYPSALAHLSAAGGQVEEAQETYAAARAEWTAIKVPDHVLAMRHTIHLCVSHARALESEQSLEDEARDLLVPNEIRRARRVLFARSSRADSL